MANLENPPIRPPRKRRFRTIVNVLAIAILLAFVATHALGQLFSSFDDPERLDGVIHFTDTNGFTLRWVEKPAATNTSLNFIFVHGSPGGAGVWRSQFTNAFPGASLFAYDRPGFGKSTPRLSRPHLQAQADALATLAQIMTTNRVLLVGHSYGSPIALLTAIEHPEKVSGVLLIGGDVDPAQENPWLIQKFFGWRATSWLLPGPLRQCNREMLSARADLEKMRAHLPELAVPVVMLHGDRDPLVPVENVAWLEAQLAGAGKTNLFSKIILPGVNHFIPWEHPQQVDLAMARLVQMAGENAQAGRSKTADLGETK
jgi:pimeloyl-ACP methyl ester carboxylesterase